MKNYLYVISDEQGRLKIGVTDNADVTQRIKTLQTGNAGKLEVLFFEERQHATKAESYLHRCFHEQRLVGEWFEGITLRDVRIKLMLFLEQD